MEDIKTYRITYQINYGIHKGKTDTIYVKANCESKAKELFDSWKIPFYLVTKIIKIEEI